MCKDQDSTPRWAPLTRSSPHIERDLLPGAKRLRDETLRRYNQGEAALVDYLLAQREYNEIVRQYRDTQVRHRQSMLSLNTVVGQRILP